MVTGSREHVRPIESPSVSSDIVPIPVNVKDSYRHSIVRVKAGLEWDYNTHGSERLRKTRVKMSKTKTAVHGAP